MSRLTRDGTTEPVSRDQILRRKQGQENINYPCSADYGQDWQPYPVDPYYALYEHTRQYCLSDEQLNTLYSYDDSFQLQATIVCVYFYNAQDKR